MKYMSVHYGLPERGKRQSSLESQQAKVPLVIPFPFWRGGERICHERGNA